MRLTALITWQPVGQPPTQPQTTAIMARPDCLDPADMVLVEELYAWDGQAWYGEISGAPADADWWWAAERDMVAVLAQHRDYVARALAGRPEAA